MKSVMLVGLGNVAVGYDLADVSQAKVLTHARAFSLHPSFRLAGGVDPDADRRHRFEVGYGVPVYSDIGLAMKALSPDVVVVATPTAMHLQTVRDVLGAGRPQAILCEKPLAYDLTEAEQIIGLCAQQECALYVNYFRLSEPGVAVVRERLADGRIGKPLKGVVWYSKGVFNSGAHFLNLLQNLLGEVSDAALIDAGRLWEGLDPEPDVDVTFAGGRVTFLSARGENFFHNTVELVAPNGRLRFEAGGARIVWQEVEEDARFAGYRRISDATEIIPTDFDRIQWYVVNQLSAEMKGQAAQLCTAAEALQTQKILSMIKEKL